MANFDEGVLLAAIENLENQENAAIQGQRRFYESHDAFAASDVDFIKNFRVTKDVANFIVDMVSPHLVPFTRAKSLAERSKVLCALNFYGTGSYQNPVGKNIFMALSQSSVSRCIKEVTDALNHPDIFNRWVHFPRNLNELRLLRHRFFEKYNFPGVVGCVDCTHVALWPPKIVDDYMPEHIFINRKQYHSLNVQLICGPNLEIINVNSRYPGSTHDAYIWRNSNVEPFFVNLHELGHKGYFLLGDSGYPLRPWLQIPILNALPESPEERYNTHHRRVRSIIEQCNGVLKMRFRCLFKHRTLHYAPTRASKIVNACVVLHNICRFHNLPDLPDVENDENIDFGMYNDLIYEDVNINQRVHRDLINGRNFRQTIVQNYYA